jgi:uncharacterized protein (TIGR03083 family)
MNPDGVWQAIDTQRAGLCDLLAELGDDEWLQPSLCAGWTVRDVAAHLTLQQLGPAGVLAQIVKWRGSIDRTTAHAARVRAAALTTEQIIAEIRATIGSRRHIFGVTQLETLCDVPGAQPGHRHPARPPPRPAGRRRRGRGQPGAVDALAAAAALGEEDGRVPAHRHRHVLVDRRRPHGPRPHGRSAPGLLRPPRRSAAALRRRRRRAHEPPHSAITARP